MYIVSRLMRCCHTLQFILEDTDFSYLTHALLQELNLTYFMITFADDMHVFVQSVKNIHIYTHTYRKARLDALVSPLNLTLEGDTIMLLLEISV